MPALTDESYLHVLLTTHGTAGGISSPKMVQNPYMKDVLRDDVVQYSAPSKLPLIAKM